MDSSPEIFAQNESNNKRDLFVTLALTVILVFGAGVRLIGVNWDEDQHLHPDERFLTMVETSLTLPGAKNSGSTAPAVCAKWGGYFDTACSPLSPYNHNFGFFVYGTFPIFLTRIVGDVLTMTGYGEINLVGRVLSALFDLSTVLIIFFIGRRMYDVRVAILGAFFLAASVLDIQQSHFFTVDTFTNVPILLAFWFALDIIDGKGVRAFVFGGAAFGLALAGRINIAPFAAVLIAAAALRAYLAAEKSRQENRAADSIPSGAAASLSANFPARNLFVPIQPDRVISEPKPASLAPYARAFGGLVACALIALIAFRIFQPYAANGPNFFAPRLPHIDMSKGPLVAGLDVALFWAGGVNPIFADNMNSINDFITGKVDFPPNHQWTDRTAYVFPFENIVLWGLGLPLGLAAWAGFALAAYELVFKKRWEHLLIVLWIGITFAYTGQQFAKTIRYFLQLYPFLCLLAGYLLVKLWDRVAQDTGHRTPDSGLFKVLGPMSLVLSLFAIVIGYTIFWSLAFTSIYTRPVSRVTASRWIFENVPVGSVIANEHWDDPLPLRVDGKDPFGGMYRGLKSSSDGLMQWYAEDTPEKRAQAIAWLDEADYIVLSSNRLYAAIPRLPMRYPLTTKYYEWLFGGTLGFENVATITSRPQLFGIEIADDNAEESFTVYDHPKVLIFKKTAGYSHGNTAALFNSVNLDEVYRFQPVQATQAKTALLLTDRDREDQRLGGTWRDIFDPDDLINRVPVFVWLALTTLLGWLAFPLAFVAFCALADRGYIFAKALGILIPAFLAWIFASVHLLSFSRASIFIAILLMAAASAFVSWRRRGALIVFVREHARILIVEEIFFLLFFAFFLLIRYSNPDLWHPNFGGEKPMDFAYLNAVIKSTWFPPYDPWFAGGFINYYYYGFVLTATLIKFSGIVPEVAYNLAIPLYFALTAMGAFSVVFNLIFKKHAATRRAFAFALLGALLVTVIGNLGELGVVLESLVRMGGGAISESPFRVAASLLAGIGRIFDGAPLDVPIGNWYWTATRIIPDTINEFPFFTFLYADLHAHLMALPYTLVALGFAVNFALRGNEHPERSEAKSKEVVQSKDNALRTILARVSLGDVVEIALASLVVGALRPLNTWDYPTYLA
ncbi:MAG: glycosyltransferase family 39 protein, partial [Chloroflexi bacterium]|nr:glycosyltransferase family 39 protein [Chloroflexota bacterium]